MNIDSSQSLGFINSSVSKQKKTEIDEEIETLEALFSHNRDIINFETNQLKKRVAVYKEPDSVKILDTKIDRERTYIQNSIIQMELNQIAESITRVTHAKKIMNDHTFRKNSFAEMVLEKYGPPIVRKTRNMEKQVEGKKRSPSKKNSSSSSPTKENLDVSKDNLGESNRPALLMRQIHSQT
jgi:hypothetical protein